MTRRTFQWAVLGVLATSTGWAAPPQVVATDPAQAGPDFAVQGEYVGSTGDGRKLGAQVIALGDDTFQAVFLAGGLPGDGWDGKTTRVRVNGSLLEKGRTQFGTAGMGWNGVITDGAALEGQTAQGVSFRLAKVVRQSPTVGRKPPEGARVLFDGTNTAAWADAKMTPDGLLLCGTRTRDEFQDFTLHLEFRTPFKPSARGQSRGNSGVYLLNTYELQILDSFGLDGKDNECGGIYTRKAPDVHMCFPPLSWQTYDIDFQAARFGADGKKTKNAVITVRHNGVLVHDRVEIPGPTGGARRRPETAASGNIQFQNHGNPVHLRNIWIVEKSKV